VSTENSTPAPVAAQCRTGDASALTDKVQSLVDEAGPDVGGLDGHAWLHEPSWMNDLTDREANIAAWGWVYGIAYGIARGEDPYERPSAVVARAYEAAVPVYRDYTNTEATA
jgi:hypothetical protein